MASFLTMQNVSAHKIVQTKPIPTKAPRGAPSVIVTAWPALDQQQTSVCPA